MSPKEVAEACGVSYSMYLNYEGLKFRAKCWRHLKGEEPRFDWRASALKIANFWRELPEDVFPEVTQAVIKTQSYFKASEQDVKKYLAGTRNNVPLLPEEVTEHVVFTKELMPFVMDALLYYMQKDERFTTTENKERNVEMFMDLYGLCGRTEHSVEELKVKYALGRARIDQVKNLILGVIRKKMAAGLVKPSCRS